MRSSLIRRTLILCDHDALDFELIARNARLIVDTQATRSAGGESGAELDPSLTFKAGRPGIFLGVVPISDSRDGGPSCSFWARIRLRAGRPAVRTLEVRVKTIRERGAIGSLFSCCTRSLFRLRIHRCQIRQLHLQLIVGGAVGAALAVMVFWRRIRAVRRREAVAQGLMPVERLGGSFRDPAGFVFTRDGVLLRQINELHREHWERFLSSGLHDALVERGLMVAVRGGPARPGRAVGRLQGRAPRADPVHLLSLRVVVRPAESSRAGDARDPGPRPRPWDVAPRRERIQHPMAAGEARSDRLALLRDPARGRAVGGLPAVLPAFPRAARARRATATSACSSSSGSTSTGSRSTSRASSCRGVRA